MNDDHKNDAVVEVALGRLDITAISLLTGLSVGELANLGILDEPDDAPHLTAALTRPRRFRRVGPCPCECTTGGFCGGCGHAGCGRR
jgi:hypothetical protein